jgi:hypothetical protein
MTPCVVVTLYDRPRYTQQMLTHLQQVDGIQEVECIFCVDPSDHTNQIVDLIETTNLKRSILVNPERLRCGANTRQALTVGFQRSDYVLRTEDDILWAPDTLHFFKWAHRQRTATTFSVSPWGTRQGGPTHQADTRLKFTPSGGYGLFRDVWENDILPAWPEHDKPEAPDTFINRTIRGDRHEIFPVLSRAQNIGAERGYYNPSPQRHADHVRLPVWAGNLEVGEGEWTL